MSNACSKNPAMVITQVNKTDITSPNWPQKYPSQSDCTWKIIAPDGAKIQLSIKGHHLEEKYVCLHFKIKWIVLLN